MESTNFNANYKQCWSSEYSDFFFMIIKLELIFMAHLHVLYNNHTWTWTITVVFLEWVWGQIMINIVLADTFIHAAVSLGAVRRSNWPYILHIITSRSFVVKNFYLQKHPEYVCSMNYILCARQNSTIFLPLWQISWHFVDRHLRRSWRKASGLPEMCLFAE